MSAVLFDLYETLISEAGRTVTRASSLGPLLEMEDSAFRREWKRTRSAVVIGGLSFGEALTQISRRLTGSADRDAIARICDNRREEKAVMFSEVDDDVASMVAALCAQGHRLAVVSNCFAEDVAAWSTWRPARHFMTTVFSFEIGAAKPDPAIYLEAMRRLGADEQSAVFIGDGGDDELAGAERVGLRGFRAGWFAGNAARSATASGEGALARCSDAVAQLERWAAEARRAV